MADDVGDIFWRIPPITRTYLSLAFATSVLCQVDLISPFQLYFSYPIVINDLEVWRLVTCFLYFGPLSLDFFFHCFFLYHYCEKLENGSFQGRKSDMVWMLFLGALVMLLLAPISQMYFLGASLSFMMVYVWSRRHPDVPNNLFGLLPFTSVYLPWVLLGFSVLLGNSPAVDLLGIAVGHVYWYFEDVYPNTPRGRDRHVFRAPRWLARLMGEGPPPQPVHDPNAPRPGGFAFAGQRQ